MRNLMKLLFAAVLVVAAIASTPNTASAHHHWCDECDATGDCFACCKCGGGTTYYCIELAGCG